VLREELEELEDELTDCISDSIKGKQVCIGDLRQRCFMQKLSAAHA
jgi:hypothetical protein